MSNNETKGFSFNINAQRTTQQSIIYWTILGAIAITSLFVVTAVIVRWALMMAA